MKKLLALIAFLFAVPVVAQDGSFHVGLSADTRAGYTLEWPSGLTLTAAVNGNCVYEHNDGTPGECSFGNLDGLQDFEVATVGVGYSTDIDDTKLRVIAEAVDAKDTGTTLGVELRLEWDRLGAFLRYGDGLDDADGQEVPLWQHDGAVAGVLIIFP